MTQGGSGKKQSSAIFGVLGARKFSVVDNELYRQGKKEFAHDAQRGDRLKSSKREPDFGEEENEQRGRRCTNR